MTTQEVPMVDGGARATLEALREIARGAETPREVLLAKSRAFHEALEIELTVSAGVVNLRS
jgi:hypothetical protein